MGTDRAIEHMSMLRDKRKGEKRERREKGAFEDAEAKTMSIYKPFRGNKARGDSGKKRKFQPLMEEGAPFLAYVRKDVC